MTRHPDDSGRMVRQRRARVGFLEDHRGFTCLVSLDSGFEWLIDPGREVAVVYTPGHTGIVYKFLVADSIAVGHPFGITVETSSGQEVRIGEIGLVTAITTERVRGR